MWPHVARSLFVASRCLQGQVRFYRKPRWLPIAKSKMYKNIELPEKSAEEGEELERLFNNHRVYYNSLREFQRQINVRLEKQRASSAQEISESGEMGRILKEVERDNAIIKEIREASMEKEWENTLQSIEERIKSVEEMELKALAEAEDKFEKDVERLKTLITEENLDEAIEKALAVVVDYNFAVDKNSHVYPGRNSKESKDIEPDFNFFNHKVINTAS